MYLSLVEPFKVVLKPGRAKVQVTGHRSGHRLQATGQVTGQVKGHTQKQ